MLLRTHFNHTDVHWHSDDSLYHWELGNQGTTSQCRRRPVELAYKHYWKGEGGSKYSFVVP